MMADVAGDVRFAVRQLRRSPGYAFTVGLTVALAVGSVAALVGVLRATLWSRLPFADADRVVFLKDHRLVQTGQTEYLMSVARYADLQTLQREGKPVFQGMGQFFVSPTAVAEAGQEPKAVQQAGVSQDFFATLGSPALLGRTLDRGDDVQGAPLRLVISYGLWQSRFAGVPNVVGRTVRLGDAQGTVVGVMGRSFAMPEGVDVWTAGRIHAENFGAYRGEGSRFINVFGRLQDGESAAAAEASMDALASRLAAQYPATDAAYSFSMQSLRDRLFGSYRRALALVAASVSILLLVVVLNLSGLQVTRGVARQPEFAIRTALGVTEMRLLRQLLTESAMLMGVAALAGLGLAEVFLRVLVAQVPRGLLAVGTPRLDATAVLAVAAFCGAVSVVVSVLSWRMSRRARHTELGTSAMRVLPTRAIAVGRALAVCQVASAFVLLALSASVLNELYRLLRTPLGFATSHVATFTVDKGWNGDAVKLHQFYGQVEDRLRALPGVEGAGSMTALPLNTFVSRRTFDVQGRPLTPEHDTVAAEVRAMSAGLLGAMQIPLLAGRALTTHDGDPGTPDVVLVNQALAERYFHGADAVGQRLLMQGGMSDTLVPAEIVGVLANVRGTKGSLGTEAEPEVYNPENGGWPHMQFAVRSDRDRGDMEAAARAIVASLDRSATVGAVVALADTVRTVEQQPLLNAELLTLFAAFGVVLVMLGVYGLAAFNLQQRVREFAVRMALGSSRDAVFRLMLRDAVRVLLWGLPVGALGVFLALRLLRAAVPFGGAPPVWTYAAAAAVLLVCALGATLQPARRAAMLDPMEALRAE